MTAAIYKEAGRWCTQFICGQDGRPSHPKLVQWAVVASYLAPFGDRIRPVPPGIAAMVIAASFGYKAWSDFVGRSSFGFATTSAVDLSHRFEKKVQEHVEILEGRNVQEGFDPSVPRTAPAPEETP